MPLEKNHILVVDDDEIILIALRESLTQKGYYVVTTSNPLDALETLKTQRFAVVISDQRMAEMNGLDFLAQCKVIQPNASRILITGVQNIKTLIQAVNKSEIFRFVGKPWIREELLAAIEAAAQRFRAAFAAEEREAVLLQRIEALEQELRAHRSEN